MDNIFSTVGDYQPRYNLRESDFLAHTSNHPLNGKRRYRRGYCRCKICGGFLSPHDITMREIDAISGVNEELKGPCSTPTVSGRATHGQWMEWRKKYGFFKGPDEYALTTS